VTRVAKRRSASSIDEELRDLQPDRYSSPIARLRVAKIVRRRELGRRASDEARELGHARDEEAAYRRLDQR
jgi:hypothetical protein